MRSVNKYMRAFYAWQEEHSLSTVAIALCSRCTLTLTQHPTKISIIPIISKCLLNNLTVWFIENYKDCFSIMRIFRKVPNTHRGMVTNKIDYFSVHLWYINHKNTFANVFFVKIFAFVKVFHYISFSKWTRYRLSRFDFTQLVLVIIGIFTARTQKLSQSMKIPTVSIHKRKLKDRRVSINL